MTKIIDYLSINDLFWVQIKTHLISFGFKGLPIDTHFTIGFDSRSPDINLHITKNTNDLKNKPKITIVTIDKTLLGQDINLIAFRLLNIIFEPFDFKEYKKNYDYNLGFISFEKFKNSNSSSLMEQDLINCFKEIAAIKKNTRLKINGDIERTFENFTKSKQNVSTICNNIIEISSEFTPFLESGIIISNDAILNVVLYNDMWHTIKTDIKPIDFASALLNIDLVKRLVYMTKRAIIKVKNSETFDDTRKFNIPIRLVRQQRKEKTQERQTS